jgi:hypothetical protein
MSAIWSITTILTAAMGGVTNVVARALGQKLQPVFAS